MRFGKTSGVLFVLCAAMLIAGCHSQEPSGTSASTAPQKAVLIETGNGMSTVYIPSSTSAGGVERLAGDKEGPVCKQCEADAAAYFSGSPLSPKCPVCGASRSPLHATN
jgi:transposase-like protein